MALQDCNERQLDLLILDYQMPQMSGLELLQELRGMANYRDVPIIIVTSTDDRETRLKAIEAGVTDFINKPFDTEELRVRVRNLLQLRVARLEIEMRAATLKVEVERATKTILAREEELIWRLARAIEYRDGGTGEHISRVARISKIIAKHLGCDPNFCQMLYLAAPLHDVGKIGIPDEILNKPGRLTDEERKIINQHTEFGGHILQDGASYLLKMARDIAVAHHEKWDGSGYPLGLSGDDIPIEARVVAVADVVDALLTKRPYKEPWSFYEVCNFVHQQSGKHFDPDCVYAFEAAKNEVYSLYLEGHSDVNMRRMA